MKRTYELIASRGNEIVFDDRLQADSPRDARREMKKLLGLKSLSGPRRLRIVDFGLRIKEGYATDVRRIEARSLCSAARVCAADWKTWCCPVVPNPQSAIRNPQSAIRNPQSAIRNSLDRMRLGHAFLGTTNLHVVAARL